VGSDFPLPPFLSVWGICCWVGLGLTWPSAVDVPAESVLTGRPFIIL
jgi:hypothetical protein